MPGHLLLVLAGGVFGAAARDAWEQAQPAARHGLPVATLLINLTGALLLGVLLEQLARRGPDTGRRRQARLLLGTGFLGAFTTYSTFAVEADLLVRDGRPLLALLYVGLTLAGGLAATAAGIGLASLGTRGRVAPLPLDPDVERDR